MKIKIKILISILLLIGILLFYWFYPVNIKLERVTSLIVSKELPGTWWVMVTKPPINNTIVQNYKLQLPQVDYNKEYLILSGGRELNKLWYRKFSNYLTSTYHNTPYLAHGEFGNILYKNTIFVYKIKKTNLTIPLTQNG